MAVWAALWTFIAGFFFVLSIRSIFKPSEKFKILSTKKNAISATILTPIVWFVVTGILALNDKETKATPEPTTEVVQNNIEISKSDSRHPLYDASSEIDGIVFDDGHLKIAIDMGGSSLSIKDLYSAASIEMTAIAKAIKAGGAEYDNVAYVDFLLLTDFSGDNGKSIKENFARFSIMHRDIVTNNYDDLSYAKIFDLVDKHQFFTTEAKDDFKKYCAEKASFSIKICK